MRECYRRRMFQSAECPAVKIDCEACKKCDHNERARENRRAREMAYLSCGLTKVRGALGGVYWE